MGVRLLLKKVYLVGCVNLYVASDNKNVASRNKTSPMVVLQINIQHLQTFAHPQIDSSLIKKLYYYTCVLTSCGGSCLPTSSLIFSSFSS